MFNVLTKDLKKNIESDYKNRRFFMIFLFLLFLFFFITIVLTPSFVAIWSEKKYVLTINDSFRNSFSSKEDEETKEIFDSTNNLLAYINSSKPSFYSTFMLSKVILSSNTGIKMTDILYQRLSSSTAIFTIKGVASNRDSLIMFSKEISSNPIFKDLNLPISNFAKDKNIEFSFDVKTSI